LSRQIGGGGARQIPSEDLHVTIAKQEQLGEKRQGQAGECNKLLFFEARWEEDLNGHRGKDWGEIVGVYKTCGNKHQKQRGDYRGAGRKQAQSQTLRVEGLRQAVRHYRKL